MTAIRRSGSEGIGRVDIGKYLGIDATIKSGNRRVSESILAVCKAAPNLIGQYQKMEGRVRSIRYFWKPDSHPERFIEMMRQFADVAGRTCPFRIGQVIKFPDTKLSMIQIFCFHITSGETVV
jgi:hypothetical protein